MTYRVVSLLLLGVTSLGCRAGGAALLVGLGSFALFSGQIARGFFPDTRDERRESRRFYARIAHWMLFAWGALGAFGGLMVLLGVLDCA